MTLSDLKDIWYMGNWNDINFVNTCYNMLMGMNVLTDEDRLRYDDLNDSIRRAMRRYLFKAVR